MAGRLSTPKKILDAAKRILATSDTSELGYIGDTSELGYIGKPPVAKLPDKLEDKLIEKDEHPLTAIHVNSRPLRRDEFYIKSSSLDILIKIQPKDFIGTAKELQDYAERLIKCVEETVSELVKRKLLTPENISTIALPDLKFTTSSRKVVFENLGHMLSFCTEMQTYTSNQLTKSGKNSSLDLMKFKQYPIKPLQHLVNFIVDRPEFSEKRNNLLYQKYNDAPDLSLTTPCLYQGNEADSNNRHNVAASALRGLREMCYQTFGGVPSEEGLKQINILSVESERPTKMLTGKRMLEVVRSEISECYGEKFHDDYSILRECLITGEFPKTNEQNGDEKDRLIKVLKLNLNHPLKIRLGDARSCDDKSLIYDMRAAGLANNATTEIFEVTEGNAKFNSIQSKTAHIVLYEIGQLLRNFDLKNPTHFLQSSLSHIPFTVAVKYGIDIAEAKTILDFIRIPAFLGLNQPQKKGESKSDCIELPLLYHTYGYPYEKLGLKVLDILKETWNYKGDVPSVETLIQTANFIEHLLAKVEKESKIPVRKILAGEILPKKYKYHEEFDFSPYNLKDINLVHRFGIIRCASLDIESREDVMNDVLKEGLTEDIANQILDLGESIHHVFMDMMLPACGVFDEKRKDVLSFICECLVADTTDGWKESILNKAGEINIEPGILRAALTSAYLMSLDKIEPAWSLDIPEKYLPKVVELEPINKKREKEEAERIKKTSLDTFSKRLVHEEHLSPQVLFFALCSLGLENEKAQSYREFDQRIIKENSSKERKSGPRSKLNPYEITVSLVERSVNAGQEIQYDSLLKVRFADLLKQLCYKKYDGDIKSIINELKECEISAESAGNSVSAKIVKSIVSDVVPVLIELFEKTQNFKNPRTLKVKLLPEQQEAVVGAVALDKQLMVLGPGSGKTEAAAGFCEYVKAEKVFWCTRPANTKDTERRLRDEILKKGAGAVGRIGQETQGLSPTEFKTYLEKHKYIIAGYDSLRVLRKTNEEQFKVLKEWVKTSARVLDEGHVLDNYDSGRSQVIQELSGSKTIICTATPFQHRPSRVATLLHLVMPERYPEPQKLEAELRKNRDKARDLINLHSTLYNVSDLAEPFKDPSLESFESQLSAGRPRIPRLEMERVQYSLSWEHGRLYADMATNWKAFAKEHGYKSEGIYQLAAIRKLSEHPEHFGAEPPLALIDAVKKIAIPALRNGEKVIIFGHRRHPLELLSKDFEFAEFGMKLLDGSISPDARSEALHNLEEDPASMCVAAQINASGSGHNCRSVSKVIVIDRPPLVADMVQGLGRPVRLLFEDDVRFAREKVNVYFLEPTIPSEIIDEVQDKERKEYLQRGAIYENWLSRDLQGIEDYHYYTARNRSASNVPNISSVAALIQDLSNSVSKFHRYAEATALLSNNKITPFGFHNNRIKNTWREAELGGFTKKELSSLGKPIDEIRVAHLPGPEALEVPVYLNLGIKPQNVFAFEGGPGVVKEICRENVNLLGCKFIDRKIEDVVPRLPFEIDIYSIDLNGYTTEATVRGLTEVKLSENALVLKNSLCGREKDFAKDLIRSAGGRENLDVILMKLASTKQRIPHSLEDPLDFLKTVKAVRRTARIFDLVITQHLGSKYSNLSNLLGELYLGCPHLKAFSQFQYTSQSGSPFLSTFARLEQWHPAIRDSDTASSLRKIMKLCIDQIMKSGVAPKSDEFKVRADTKGKVSIVNSTLGIVTFQKKDLDMLISYFNQAVPMEFRLDELLYSRPPRKMFA